MKKKYIIPDCGVIRTLGNPGLLYSNSYTQFSSQDNWKQDKSGQSETPSGSGSSTPGTVGDHTQTPGGDIEFGKRNGWSLWDE